MFVSFGSPSAFPPLDSDIFPGSAIPKLGPSCIPCHDVSNLFRMVCRVASILSVLSQFCISSSSILLRQTSGSILEVGGAWDTCSDMGELTREEGLLYAVCAANSELLSPIPNAPMVTWHIVQWPVSSEETFLLSGQPSSAVEVTQSHRLTEGKTRVWIIRLNTIERISPDRGENQREKSKVSLLPVSPYYTTLGCARTHYLVRTDPMLHGPLTDSGCGVCIQVISLPR